MSRIRRARSSVTQICAAGQHSPAVGAGRASSRRIGRIQLTAANGKQVLGKPLRPDRRGWPRARPRVQPPCRLVDSIQLPTWTIAVDPPPPSAMRRPRPPAARAPASRPPASTISSSAWHRGRRRCVAGNVAVAVLALVHRHRKDAPALRQSHDLGTEVRDQRRSAQPGERFEVGALHGRLGGPAGCGSLQRVDTARARSRNRLAVPLDVVGASAPDAERPRPRPTMVNRPASSSAPSVAPAPTSASRLRAKSPAKGAELPRRQRLRRAEQRHGERRGDGPAVGVTRPPSPAMARASAGPESNRWIPLIPRGLHSMGTMTPSGRRITSNENWPAAPVAPTIAGRAPAAPDRGRSRNRSRRAAYPPARRVGGEGPDLARPRRRPQANSSPSTKSCTAQAAAGVGRSPSSASGAGRTSAWEAKRENSGLNTRSAPRRAAGAVQRRSPPAASRALARRPRGARAANATFECSLRRTSGRRGEQIVPTSRHVGGFRDQKTSSQVGTTMLAGYRATKSWSAKRKAVKSRRGDGKRWKGIAGLSARAAKAVTQSASWTSCPAARTARARSSATGARAPVMRTSAIAVTTSDFSRASAQWQGVNLISVLRQ